MINISWTNFDKAFWLTANNMRRLISFTIQIGDSTNSLEQRQDTLDQKQSQTDQKVQENQDWLQQTSDNVNVMSHILSELQKAVPTMQSDIDDLYAKYTALLQRVNTLESLVNAHYRDYPPK